MEYDNEQLMKGMTVSSVMADVKAPLVKDTSRLEYLERYIPYWRQSRQFRAYSIMLAIVGVVMLFRIPLLAVPCFAGAAYFHVMGQLKQWYSQGDYADHRTLLGAD